MEKRMNTTRNKNTRKARGHSANIVYSPGLDGYLDHWAAQLGCDVDTLRLNTVSVIRNCHHAAVVAWEKDECHPYTVYSLGLGKLQVFYSGEEHGMVVRGYSVNLPREQTTEEEGGFWIC